MKRFIIKIILFFVLVLFLDQLGGRMLHYCYTHSKGGQTKALYDLCNTNEYDVLILGSSQANHHYDPNLMADSLQLSVYNGGMDGNGIILMNGIQRMIHKRYNPKLIIYNVTPSFDYFRYSNDDNNRRYITSLKPFYDNTQIQEIVNEVSPLEKFKMKSLLYRYNTVFVNTVKNYFVTGYHNNLNGYEPLNGVLDYEPEPFKDSGEYDNLKIKYLKDFIERIDASETELVFVFSPRYGSSSSAVFDTVKTLCNEYDIEYWDYYSDSSFVFTKTYYEDPMHLNKNGAELFTQIVVERIKNR